jgi:hypothetical protein
MYVDF